MVGILGPAQDDQAAFRSCRSNGRIVPCHNGFTLPYYSGGNPVGHVLHIVPDNEKDSGHPSLYAGWKQGEAGLAGIPVRGNHPDLRCPL